jgi:calcium-dependent protein kinase
MFKGMDSDNSGTITVDELRRGLAKQGTKLSEAEVEQLMAAVSFHACIRSSSFSLPHAGAGAARWVLKLDPERLIYDREQNQRMQADADGNGTIDYEEFITATMHMNRMDREEHLYTAFQYFDKDGSG